MFIPTSQAVYLLENISSFHNISTNHSEIMQQLRCILDHQGQLMNQYLIPTVLYLKRNLQHNIKIIDSLNCLVLLQPLLTLSLKHMITGILSIKYPPCNFSEEVNKLKMLNQDLVFPYFQILSNLTQWYRLSIEDKCYHEVSIIELQYQLQYLYTFSKYHLQQDSIIEGLSFDQHLLTIYRLSQENTNIFDSWLNSKQIIHKMAVSLFFTASTYNSIPSEHAKVIFHVICQLIRYIQELQFSFEEEIMKQLLSILRNEGPKIRQNKSHFIICFQNGMIGILGVYWSLDKEFKWSWLSKIIWDLLGLDESDQIVLIQQLRATSKQLMRTLELND